MATSIINSVEELRQADRLGAVTYEGELKGFLKKNSVKINKKAEWNFIGLGCQAYNYAINTRKKEVYRLNCDVIWLSRWS